MNTRSLFVASAYFALFVSVVSSWTLVRNFPNAWKAAMGVIAMLHTPSVSGGIFWALLFSLMGPIAACLYTFLLIVTCIGLFKSARWAAQLFVVLLSLGLLAVSVNWFLFGTFARVSPTFCLEALVTIVFLIALYKDPLLRLQKGVVFCLSVLGVAWIFYGVSLGVMHYRDPRLFQMVEKTTFQPPMSSVSSAAHRLQVLNYSIAIPTRFKTLSERPAGSNSGVGRALFNDPIQKETIWIQQEDFYQLLKGSFPRKNLIAHDQNNHDFALHFIQERYGWVILILHQLELSKGGEDRFYDIESDRWRGISRVFKQTATSTISEFTLWEKQTQRPIHIVFIGKDHLFDPQTQQSVLASLEWK